MSEYQEEIDKFGFATASQFIGDRQIKKLIECLSELNNLPSKKSGTAYGVRNLLNLSPEIRKLAKSRKVGSLVGRVLGQNAKPMRAIFFDKTAEANWKVPWHQDLTIAVKEKRETKGFTAWTRKAGVARSTTHFNFGKNSSRADSFGRYGRNKRRVESLVEFAQIRTFKRIRYSKFTKN